MDKHTLPRGDQTVIYQKAPVHFAVRLRAQHAQQVMAEVEHQAAMTAGIVRHVASLAPEPLDLFAVEKEDTLEDVMQALRAVSDVEMVTHVYTLKDPADASAAGPPTERALLGSALIPTGRLTVQFRAGTSANTCRKILDNHDLAATQVLDFLPHGYTARLAGSASENPLKLAARLMELKEIVRAEPDMIFRIDRKYHPTDTLYSRQWHLNNSGAVLGQTLGADVQAPAAWEITRGSREVVVCLIDDGFDLDHSDLTGPDKVIAPWNFVEENSQPRPARPGDNHGTACAGLAIAEENGQGVVGLAPGCAWMPLRVGDWLSDELIVAFLQHAAYHGADVITCGWSAEAWNFPLSTKIHAAIHQAATREGSSRRGCVLLFAAGDENRPLDGYKDGQRSYQGFALHPDVLAVGASTSQDRRAGYSNFGPGLAVCAPSSGLRRMVTTDRSGSDGFAAGDYTFDFGGTSAAVSLTAGLAALVLSANPKLSAVSVRQIIRDTAEKIDTTNGIYNNGVSPWYGCGRIHAARAVARACATEADLLPRQLLLESRPNRAIPDRGVIEDILPCGLDQKIRALLVDFEIRSIYHGLLRLALLPPSGQQIELLDLDTVPGTLYDFTRSYDSTRDSSMFEALIGTSPRGDWRLRVEGRADFTTGVLARWSMTFTY